MSKNTSSNAFRKIDVDQFNEDNFKDEEGISANAGGVSPGSEAIAGLLQSGKNVEALKSVLSSAPIGNKNQEEKVRILWSFGKKKSWVWFKKLSLVIERCTR